MTLRSSPKVEMTAYRAAVSAACKGGHTIAKSRENNAAVERQRESDIRDSGRAGVDDPAGRMDVSHSLAISMGSSNSDWNRTYARRPSLTGCLKATPRR
jgi:hypothetical protein